ncbi:25770_t:CDS:1, partial [Gigaspora margarita]
MELILNDISNSEAINAKALNALDFIIKKALPSSYKYFIKHFEQISSHNFLGAYEMPFKVDCCINISTIKESKEWIQRFIDLHKVMMRETHERTIKGIHYILSKRFHCIHSYVVKIKQGIKDNCEIHIENARIRDTDCSSILSIQLLKRSDPYPCIISLYFHHNHSLKSSHVTSFRPISNETKNEIFRLFEASHNP